MNAVRAHDVVVRYGNVTALASSSFELASGSVTALIGANGSGKTTLLHVLAGLVRPSRGTIDHANAATTSLVAQQHRQHQWVPLTVREVVRMGRYRRTGLVGPLRAHDRHAIAAAVGRADVTELLNRPYGELSGGQQQRVRIAQALAGEPDLLLLDEPITGLDPPSQERILEIISAERDRGTTVVFSTHHLDEARRADEVLVLDGTVLACGPPDETLRADVLSAAFGGRMLVVGGSRPDASTNGGDQHADVTSGILLVDDHGHGHHGHDEHGYDEHRHDERGHDEQPDEHDQAAGGCEHVVGGLEVPPETGE